MVKEPDNPEKSVGEVIQKLTGLTDQIEKNQWEILRIKVGLLADVISKFSSDGVLFVTFSQHGRILYADKKAAALFGYEVEELIEQPIEMLVPSKLRGNHNAHRKNFMANPTSRAMGHSITLGAHGLRKDGTEFKIGVSLMPGTIDIDHVVCAICTKLAD